MSPEQHQQDYAHEDERPRPMAGAMRASYQREAGVARAVLESLGQLADLCFHGCNASHYVLYPSPHPLTLCPSAVKNEPPTPWGMEGIRRVGGRGVATPNGTQRGRHRSTLGGNAASAY